MSDDERVQRLIEVILDSGISVEEACLDSPDLLPQVRDGWRKFRAMEARLGELFPSTGTSEERVPASPNGDLPIVPGFDLIEMLGRGGVGIVYKAVHLRLNHIVALKMLLSGTFATRAERLRFSREAETVARLRHPNIVQIYDVGECDTRPYFTMEFLEGGSLAEMIAGTPRPNRLSAEMVATLAEAMHAAHQEGVIHRDLKPSNVLLDAYGTPKIADFGLARHLEVDSSLTQSGAVVGTPGYMAPEQALGKSGETGFAADLYSLGAVLYELLTGRPPFRAESAAETIHQVISQDPVSPSRLNARVSRDLETICLKCLHKDPQQRYGDAAALAGDLRRFLRGEAIRARPESLSRLLARNVRRRPAFSAALAAVAILSATLVGGGFWLISERVATARALVAERKAVELATEEHLREMSRWLRKSSWVNAAAALERARGRLGGRGSADLGARLDRKARELDIAIRGDAIHLENANSPGGKALTSHWYGQYTRALAEAGIGAVGEDPAIAAGRVRASDIRNALLAMLDECAMLSPDDRHKLWHLEVARLADDDPTGWRNRVRGLAGPRDKAILAELAATAPLDDLDIPLILRMGEWMQEAKVDPVPLLRRAQRAHPADFWINALLGHVLLEKNEYAEALRYQQAAISTRPDAGLIYNEIGNTLKGAHRYEEAVEHLKRAIETNPTAAAGHYNLAVALNQLGRRDEALEHFRVAARLDPKEAMIQLALGTCLESTGRDADAVAAYRRAATLDPKSRTATTYLRKPLIRLGRGGEARDDWSRILAADPPNHDEWYGYAELCCFLGLEEEYRRARQALLAKFGATTDPPTAERVARACLLRPASDDEMRRIVALGERAWGVDRSRYGTTYDHFLFLRGLAEYRGGRLDEAISLMRGEASRALGPAPRLVLSLALHRAGRSAEARATLAAAILSHDWRTARIQDQDDWIYHSLRREAEGLILPDRDAFLDGRHQPRDNDERLALLGVCQSTDRTLASARLYSEAFAADPRLADFRTGHRFNAARAACLAGQGQGLDAAMLGNAERGRWREQARGWLRDDLAGWSKLVEDPKAHDEIRRELERWREEPDLACIRDPSRINPPGPDESEACHALWRAVDACHDRAMKAKGDSKAIP